MVTLLMKVDQKLLWKVLSLMYLTTLLLRISLMWVPLYNLQVMLWILLLIITYLSNTIGVSPQFDTLWILKEKEQSTRLFIMWQLGDYPNPLKHLYISCVLVMFLAEYTKPWHIWNGLRRHKRTKLSILFRYQNERK